MSQRAANRRIRLLGAALAIALACALARAGWIQVVRASSLARLADAQQTQTLTIPAPRGAIVDRNNVELAANEDSVTIYADPKLVRSPAATTQRVVEALGLDVQAGTELLGKLADRKSRFVYVARKASLAQANRVKRLKLAGFGYTVEPKRIYPQGVLAAQTIGFAGLDNRGLAGLEKQYDKSLVGRDGKQTVVRDPAQRLIDVKSTTVDRPGANLALTIDNAIQLYVQQELARALKTWRARSASAVVLDPHTGEVLAMATAPTYDANKVGETAQDLQRNRTVTDTYEPGSTFKLVTIAGALSEGLVTPQTAFTLPYSIKVADKIIHDSHPRATELMTVSKILTVSSNVGVATISTQLLGTERLARWIKRFGFGEKTGVDFPGESQGIVLPQDKWYGSATGTIPIGQGIAVTPIQLAAAYAAIANEGVWIQPHLVARVGGKAASAAKRRRVVTPVVAEQLMSMLGSVVDEGTGVEAEIPNYSVAGKTGTAAKPDPVSGGYSTYKYVASFVGIVPASDPRLVILVTVDEPKGAIWGGSVAAPAFKQIALDCLRYLEVPPDRPS
ncbi:MAG TPA: penicillin-binding protein 2 [Gaiellaceae bacterium]